MSTHQKLSPKDTPITKLNRLWRDDLAEDDRDYWREQFESSRTQAGLRHGSKVTAITNRTERN